jgi:tryptophan synthase alpha subunit
MDFAAWELALPAGGWSAATGGTIATALSQTQSSLDEALPYARRLRPAVAVIYSPSIRRLGREALLDRLAGSFDQIMLEAPEPDEAGWISACARRRLGWTSVRSASRLSEQAASRLADTLPPRGSVYLSMAEATGGTPTGSAVLADAVALLRGLRDDLILIAGFGISTPAQVADLAAIDGLDAVAIGTGLLERVPAGAGAAVAYLETLRQAAGGRTAAHAFC